MSNHKCEHEHDHSHDEPQSGFEQTLYPYIDTTKIVCLNEHVPQAGKSIIKPYDQRLTSEPYLESAVDEELILQIPFTVSVNIKSIVVIGADEESCPSRVKLFKNRDGVDFGNADELVAEQSFDLALDRRGELDLMVRPSKFQNVNQLTLYFPSNHSDGEQQTRITYVGIKGTSTTYRRGVVENAVYESKPQLADHTVKAETTPTMRFE